MYYFFVFFVDILKKVKEGKNVVVARTPFFTQYFVFKNKMAEFASVVQKFISENQSDLSSDGKLHVCIAGGGGFIGSHIAKRLKEEVNICEKHL